MPRAPEPTLFVVLGEGAVVAQDIAEMLRQVRPDADVAVLPRDGVAGWTQRGKLRLLLANMAPDELLETGLPERAERVVLLSDEPDTSGIPAVLGWTVVLRPFVTEDLARFIPADDDAS